MRNELRPIPSAKTGTVRASVAYNTVRPHSGIGNLPPAIYAKLSAFAMQRDGTLCSIGGCTFCFFQQKIEWVRLMHEHPEAFEEAKAYEKNAVEHGSPFTWSQGESLDELSQPDRVAQIRQDHEQRLARMKARVQPNPLRADSEPMDIDDLYGKAKVCLACHK